MVIVMSSELLTLKSLSAPVSSPLRSEAGLSPASVNGAMTAVAGQTLTTASGKVLPLDSGSRVIGTLANSADSSVNNRDKRSSPTGEEVEAAVRDINGIAQTIRRELNFSVDEDLGRIVVKVMDHETKEVIRQIPADEVLALAKRLREGFNEKGNLLTLEV